MSRPVALDPTVVAEGLHVRYGTVHAVDAVTLHAAAGEVLGLVGGNGAGKSSTMRAIAGVLPVGEGTLRVGGHDLRTAAGVEAARALTGFCPDQGGLVRQATIREHIHLALAFHGRLDAWGHALGLAERLDLGRHLDQTTAGFSHGMSRRLSVLLAVLSGERLLILDEPFDGVDPLGVDVTLELIATAAQAGVCVLVSSHLLELVAGCATRLVVMARGRIVEETTPAALSGPGGQAHYRSLLAGEPAPPVAAEALG